MARGWKISLTLAAVVFVALVGLAIASMGAGETEKPAVPVGRITQMEQSGEMSKVWVQHRQMLERMQQDASPAMVEIMNNDPMWQMMRTPEWARMDEQHQQDLNRMLGK